MTPTQVDRRTFLKRLKASGLLDPPDFKAVLARLPETERGRVVARTLVEWGVLTKFQAELLMAGRTSGFLLGQYRILDQLGQGGMGRVYKAVHQAMGRVVALKVLAPQHVKTERARELFRREVLATARLAHPNIVTAYDAGFADGRHYLAMEYVDGPNLERVARERGPLAVGLACEVVRQAALGLQYAHERGLVHRDVKPSNLLVQRGPLGSPTPFVVKILDFGLARLHDPIDGGKGGAGTILTPNNVVMGTPDYLSPEQARSLHAVDIRSDLYSLGCTFYHLLTGQVPYPGGTALEKLIRHTTEEPTPVEAFRPELEPEVAAVLRRLMARDPARRYQTPAEAAAALAPFSVAGGSDLVSAGDTIEYCTNTDSTSPGTVPGSFQPGEPAAAAGGEFDLDGVPLGGLEPTPLSLEEDLSPLVRERDRERRRRRWKLVFLTAGTLSVLTGLITLAVLAGR
jgi:serine/threonine protein kinase